MDLIFFIFRFPHRLRHAHLFPFTSFLISSFARSLDIVYDRTKKKLGNPIKDNGGSESSRARARREEVEVEERPTQKKKEIKNGEEPAENVAEDRRRGRCHRFTWRLGHAHISITALLSTFFGGFSFVFFLLSLETLY